MRFHMLCATFVMFAVPDSFAASCQGLPRVCPIFPVFGNSEAVSSGWEGEGWIRGCP